MDVNKWAVIGFCGAAMLFNYTWFYQAVRRSWRFGQKRPVHIHVFASNQDGAVVANIKRKQEAAQAMAEAMSRETLAAVRESVLGSKKDTNDYAPARPIVLPSFLFQNVEAAA